MAVISTYSLEGYFDESGTHEGSRAVSVAGYISTPEQWQLFEQEWACKLGEYGIERWHHTDFTNRVSPFDWPNPLAWSRLAEMIGIINRHVLASVGFVLLRDSYESIISETTHKIVGGPYGMAAAGCFISVGKSVGNLYPSARIAYVFEAGTEGAGQVLQTFNANVKHDPEHAEKLKLVSLAFQGKDVLPLQAADMLAHELADHLPRQLGRDPRNVRLQDMTMLEGAKLTDWGYLDDDELRKWDAVLSGALGRFV